MPERRAARALKCAITVPISIVTDVLLRGQFPRETRIAWWGSKLRKRQGEITQISGSISENHEFRIERPSETHAWLTEDVITTYMREAITEYSRSVRFID